MSTVTTGTEVPKKILVKSEIEAIIKEFKCTASYTKISRLMYIFGPQAHACKAAILNRGQVPFNIKASVKEI